jgi:hypothetical protein
MRRRRYVFLGSLEAPEKFRIRAACVAIKKPIAKTLQIVKRIGLIDDHQRRVGVGRGLGFGPLSEENHS